MNTLFVQCLGVISILSFIFLDPLLFDSVQQYRRLIRIYNYFFYCEICFIKMFNQQITDIYTNTKSNVSGKEFYVCDFKGHCVVVFDDEGRFLRRIGCENVTNFPNGIDVSDAGDVLIGDSHGNKFHVAVFSRDGVLVTEFECPYVKVRIAENA